MKSKFVLSNILALLVSLAVCFSADTVLAYTVKSGAIGAETWTAGTYYVENTVTWNGTLTLEAGCVVKFANGATLDGNGVIVANGTMNNKIYFTSMHDDSVGETIVGSTGVPAKGDWAATWWRGTSQIQWLEVRFGTSLRQHGQGATTFDHVHVRDMSDSGIKSYYGSGGGCVRDSTIENCDGNGIDFCASVVERCVIRGCGGTGIRGLYSYDYSIRDNVVSGCGGGISLSYQSDSTRPGYIENNLIIGGNTGVYFATNYYAGTVPTVYVRNNTVVETNYYAFYAAYTKEGSHVFSDNIVANNLGFGVSGNAPVWGNYNCLYNNVLGNYWRYHSGANDIYGDPLFTPGSEGVYYLDQADSPCIDTGSRTASDAGLDTYTTSPMAGATDIGVVDIGYHYPPVASYGESMVVFSRDRYEPIIRRTALADIGLELLNRDAASRSIEVAIMEVDSNVQATLNVSSSVILNLGSQETLSLPLTVDCTFAAAGEYDVRLRLVDLTDGTRDYTTVRVFATDHGYRELFGTLSGPTIYQPGTYYVSSTFSKPASRWIFFEAGCVLKFAPGATLGGDGIIITRGTESENVYFTSMHDDSVGERIVGSTGAPAKGDWAPTWWRGTSQIQWLEVRYGTSLREHGQGATTFDHVHVRDMSDSGIKGGPGGWVRDSTIENCDGNGIDFCASVVERCVIRGCGGTGITGRYAYGYSIRDNVVSGCGGGISLSYQSDSTRPGYIENNLIIGGNTGVYFATNHYAGTVPAVYVRNNTVVESNYYGYVAYSTEGSHVFSDNIAANNLGFGVYGASRSAVWGDYNCFYNNLLGNYWRYHSGANDIYADPLFTAGSEGVYYLDQSGSPSIDTGSRTSLEAGLDTYTTSPNNIADTGTVDIGYHYAITAPPVTGVLFARNSQVFAVERGSTIQVEVVIMNYDNAAHSVTLTTLNPVNDIVVDFPTPLIEIRGGQTLNVPLNIDATNAVNTRTDVIAKVTSDADPPEDRATITVFVTEPGQGDLPDLVINTTDMSFSPDPAVPNDTMVISATIKNQGLAAASAFSVRFFDFDTLIGEVNISGLDAGASREAAIEWTFPDESIRPVTIVVDPLDAVQELSERNNVAVKLLQVGQPDLSTAIIVVEASTAFGYQNSPASVNGKAYYQLSSNGTPVTFPVQGGIVKVTITETSDEFSGAKTDVNGNFSQVIMSPASDGEYHLSVEATDGTVTGETEILLIVQGTPPTAPTPPANPGDPNPDIYLFSQDIGFTPTLNPQAGEEITIFALIHYFGTDPVFDIPVGFFDIFFSGGSLFSQQIGSTTISFPNAGNGVPALASMKWSSAVEAPHIIQVVTYPTFVQYEGNDAATRLIFVGPQLSLEDAIRRGIEDLCEAVKNLPGLNKGERKSLCKRLEHALERFERALKEGEKKPSKWLEKAQKDLRKFIERIERLVDKGDITPETGDLLVTQTNVIVDLIDQLKPIMPDKGDDHDDHDDDDGGDNDHGDD